MVCSVPLEFAPWPGALCSGVSEGTFTPPWLLLMAGRVRNGLDTLFVIRDARQNYNALSLFAAEINRDCAETVNGTRYRYEAYCEENNLSCPETDMIKTVEKMFACVRYSP